MPLVRSFALSLALSLSLIPSPAPAAPIELLNVSYDPTRELYQQINAAFAGAGRRRPSSRSPSSKAMADRASRPARSSTAFPPTLSRSRSAYDIDEIAKRGLISRQLAGAAAEQQHALLFDDRPPRPPRQPEAHPGLGRPRPAGRQGHHPQPEDERRRALELSRCLGLCAEEIRLAGKGEAVHGQAVPQRARARQRRARVDHDLRRARPGRRPHCLGE